MSDGDNSSGISFLDHPEVEQLFISIFSNLVSESDRGAVLIGTSHVDLHLRNLFEAIAPKGVSRRELRRILDYPGALSSLSAKADIAYLARLIPDEVNRAIHHLRRIRNEVAHTPDSFRLADHEERLRKMFEVGEGVPTAINRWACEAIIKTAVSNVLKVKKPFSEEEEPIFSSPQEVLDYLAERPEIMATLNERRPRYELAWGIGIICGLIVFHRDRAKEALGDSIVISSLARLG